MKIDLHLQKGKVRPADLRKNYGQRSNDGQAWSVDPQIKIEEGVKHGSIFDALEGLDADACLSKCVRRPSRTNHPPRMLHSSSSGPMLCRTRSRSWPRLVGRHMTSSSRSKAPSRPRVYEERLTDQHYHALASKAAILRPDQLNVSEDKFLAKFGPSWKDAPAPGKAFIATDGCEELGLDAPADRESTRSIF